MHAVSQWWHRRNHATCACGTGFRKGAYVHPAYCSRQCHEDAWMRLWEALWPTN